MSSSNAENIYEQIVKPLPAAEKLRLIEKIAQDLSASSAGNEAAEASSGSYNWMSLRGIAPNLMQGVDAQAWVTQARHEPSETREQQWSHG
jgi:hypothetical protein